MYHMLTGHIFCRARDIKVEDKEIRLMWLSFSYLGNVVAGDNCYERTSANFELGDHNASNSASAQVMH